MTNAADNPWQRLPLDAPFVLPEDHAAIANFNASAPGEKFVHLEVLPEPFLGRPDVVVLGLNPGFKDTDLVQHRDPAFAIRSRCNLLHGPANYPFYLLDPEIERTKWWERKLGALIQRTDLQTVARGVLCVEYFPYHSRRFGHRWLALASQQYSFGLVRQSLQRDAVIILLRSERLWFAAMPELASYRRLYRIKNPQNPTLSVRNCPEGYDRVVEALNKMG